MNTMDSATSNAADDVESGADCLASEVTQQQLQLWQLLQSLTGRLGETDLKMLVNETVRAVERHCIEAALAMTDGNRSAAAKVLGLSRQSLYVKLARYQIGAD